MPAEKELAMGYGPYFKTNHAVDGQPATVIMRPAQEGDAAALAMHLQDFTVQQFVSMQGGRTPKDEDEFLERIRTDQDTISWIVSLKRASSDEKLVGATSLSRRHGNRLISGILLVNRQLWGKGIASLTHELRTWYAFCELGACAIDSVYLEANEASGKALRKVGYVPYGRRPRVHLTAGRWRDEILLSAYNPATISLLWPDGDVPAEITAGVKLTQAALDRAAAIIQPR